MCVLYKPVVAVARFIGLSVGVQLNSHAERPRTARLRSGVEQISIEGDAERCGRFSVTIYISVINRHPDLVVRLRV